jgi:ectoine hydroxylase-related dioxygenase (phytanoyl-CoA dioxygenase family)
VAGQLCAELHLSALRHLDSLQAAFHDDGVVCVRAALDANGLAQAEHAYRWSLEHPGPGAKPVLAGAAGAFYQDHANPAALPLYRALACDTGLADLLAAVLGTTHLWLLYEQVWLKDGGAKERTPWHQDLPYIALGGEHAVTAWITLDPVMKADALEFVRGSHRGPLYNPTAFNAQDRSTALYDDAAWPAIPDIDATRDAWPIVSWAVEPGDVILFHMAMLHGGAATPSGIRRRTISLRCCGDDAYCAPRPFRAIDERDDEDGDPIEQMARAPPGSPFRHPGFPQLR